MKLLLWSLTMCAAWIAASPTTSAQNSANQYYELLEYQGIEPGRLGELDAFLEKALLPSLKRMGIENVGVMSTPQLTEGKVSMYLLVPLTRPDQLTSILDALKQDASFISEGKNYLETDFKKPVYSRMRSELLLAFDCMPKLVVPTQKKANKDRLFELRRYESPTERMGALKVEMFNSEEVAIFRDCGIQPVFFGQALVGDHMPNLTYMTVYDNAEQRDACWKRFTDHPEWAKLKVVEKYVGTVSKVTKIDLLPRPYSQL